MPSPSARAFLEGVGGERTIVRYRQGDAIFTEGDVCQHVLYIWSGGVKVSAQSKVGKEAVVAVLGPGDFLGEGCLTGQPLRIRSAVAIRPSALVLVERGAMVRLLRHQQGLSELFISHVLTRHIRMEEDSLDQLFGVSEIRVARALLRMAHYGETKEPARTPSGNPGAKAGRDGRNDRVGVRESASRGSANWALSRSKTTAVSRSIPRS